MKLGEAIGKFEEFEPACSWWNGSEGGGYISYFDGTTYGEAHLFHKGKGEWEPVGLDVYASEDSRMDNGRYYIWTGSTFVETDWDTLLDKLNEGWKRHVELHREVNLDDLLA